jgi:hypothetical protein
MPRVGERFMKNVKFLRQLRGTRSVKQRMRMINDARPDQIFAIMDAANNILNGRFPMTKDRRARLVPFGPQIRKLSRVRTDKNARMVMQIGGGSFIPALLAPVLIHIGSHLVDKLIDSFKKK